jgi:hypothetical protein
MALMKTLLVRVRTGVSGTDGDVYVGIGGREFIINSVHDDFEQGDDRTYIIGERPNPLPSPKPTTNKPTYLVHVGYLPKTEDLDLFPVYIRLAGGGEWGLEYVEIRVNPETENIIYSDLGSPGQQLILDGGQGDVFFIHPAPPTLTSGKTKKKTLNRV